MVENNITRASLMNIINLLFTLFPSLFGTWLLFLNHYRWSELMDYTATCTYTWNNEKNKPAVAVVILSYLYRLMEVKQD